jgi:YVTN family beta-propeller protein
MSGPNRRALACVRLDFPRMRRAIVTTLACAAALALAAPAAHAEIEVPGTHDVIFVGNNWEGTATVIDEETFQPITTLDIVPDLQERMTEILANPVRLGYFLAIRNLVGEGHDQFVDDMYSSRDGRLLVVARPSLADVVGIDLASGEIAWRFPMEGQRSDHMGVSPNGRHVAVSDSTANKVHVLNVKTGEKVGEFLSGDSPHENTYSEDGDRIYHASIGMVYTPADEPTFDSTKGDRWFQVVDAHSFEVLERIDMGEKLAEAGYPRMSSAVRPMALSPSERRVYLQVSFFHGFAEYNLRRDKVTRVARLPIAEHVKDLPRSQYLLDSAHHGIAISGDGRRICAAGTMSDYVAMVSRRTFDYELIKAGKKPYWSTTSPNGRRCYVSWSGSDRISVISYRTGREIARVPVGDHPQRVRSGYVRDEFIAAHR